jgi:DNA-binding NtrC family response regulator
MRNSTSQGPRLAHLEWPRSVLLVDDIVTVREAVAEARRTMGIVVFEAASPNDAIRLSSGRRRSIDLLITDIQMPEINGWGLAATIVSRRERIDVLYISGGYSVSEWKAHPQRIAGSYFLAKPFTGADLQNTLQLIAEDSQRCVPTSAGEINPERLLEEFNVIHDP